MRRQSMLVAANIQSKRIATFFVRLVFVECFDSQAAICQMYRWTSEQSCSAVKVKRSEVNVKDLRLGMFEAAASHSASPHVPVCPKVHIQPLSSPCPFLHYHITRIRFLLPRLPDTSSNSICLTSRVQRSLLLLLLPSRSSSPPKRKRYSRSCGFARRMPPRYVLESLSCRQLADQ